MIGPELQAQKRAEARRHGLPTYRIQEILAEVAQLHGTTVQGVTGRAKVQKVIAARKDAAARLRRRGLTLSQVGMALGGRDHSTVINLLGEAA
jgi:chromosomal replication initiation ATPase DnaA